MSSIHAYFTLKSNANGMFYIFQKIYLIGGGGKKSNQIIFRWVVTLLPNFNGIHISLDDPFRDWSIDMSI